MGCFDSVRVKCPSCSHDVEFQSKSGPCSLASFSLEDAPEDVLEDVNRHAPIECNCGEKLVVLVGFKGRSVVAVK